MPQHCRTVMLWYLFTLVSFRRAKSEQRVSQRTFILVLRISVPGFTFIDIDFFFSFFFYDLFCYNIALLLLSVLGRNRPRFAVVYGWLAAAVKSSLRRWVSIPRHKPEKLMLDYLPVAIGAWERLRSSTSVIWLGRFHELGAIMLDLLLSLF